MFYSISKNNIVSKLILYYLNIKETLYIYSQYSKEYYKEYLYSLLKLNLLENDLAIALARNSSSIDITL